MAYIESMKALQRVKSYLEEMRGLAENHVWTCNSKVEAKKLQYQIQNAFWYAAKMNLPVYAELAALFEIKVTDNKVIAKVRDLTITASHSHEEITDVLDAIQALVEMKPTELPVKFPNVEVTQETQEIMASWAGANGYALVNDSDEAGFTLKKMS